MNAFMWDWKWEWEPKNFRVRTSLPVAKPPFLNFWIRHCIVVHLYKTLDEKLAVWGPTILGQNISNHSTFVLNFKLCMCAYNKLLFHSKRYPRQTCWWSSTKSWCSACKDSSASPIHASGVYYNKWWTSATDQSTDNWPHEREFAIKIFDGETNTLAVEILPLPPSILWIRTRIGYSLHTLTTN